MASSPSTAPAPFSGKGAAARSVPSTDLFYTGVHARNIGMVKKVLEVVLPVAYSDDFYRRLQEAPPELAKLVYYRDICVGVLGCRVEAAEGEGAAGAPPRIYLTVLAVLAPYRDRGIGSALLRGVLEAMEGGKIKGAEGAREIYLHVWEENKEAVRGGKRGGRQPLPPRAPPHCSHCTPAAHAPHRTHSDCILSAGGVCCRRSKGGKLLQADCQPPRRRAAQSICPQQLAAGLRSRAEIF